MSGTSRPDEPVRKQILLVDDDPQIAEVVRTGVTEAGYELTYCAAGDVGLKTALSKDFDAIILDLQLPGLGGMEICRRIRAAGCTAPVMILSLRGEELDKVLGLELGADDYVVKPVGVRELSARLRALVRRGEVYRLAGERSAAVEDSAIRLGDLTVSMARRTVKVGVRQVDLTAVEFDILATLLSRPGRVFSREEITEAVWGIENAELTVPLSTHVSRMRQKLEDDRDRPQYVLTVRGIGYKVPAPDELNRPK